MCPMLLGRLSDGPAMVLSPSAEHPFVQFPTRQNLDSESFQNSSSVSGTFTAPNACTVKSSFNNSYSIKRPSSFSPAGSNLSRKRSHDEALFEDEPNRQDASRGPAVPSATTVIKEEPIYGEGMVLLNPHTGMALSAESQTGTWYEEMIENTAAAAPPISSRSINARSTDCHSRKAQRLDISAPGLDDVSLASIHRRLQDSNDEYLRRSAGSHGSLLPQDPQVDEATHLLGISWQRVRENDGDLAAAVRGWKKFIDNQFSRYLCDSEILMKNRALNAYLVAARPVQSPSSFTSSKFFYLFTEDLDQAQLVGSTWNRCIQNLRSVPIVFEGAQVMQAADKGVTNRSSNSATFPTIQADNEVPLLQAISAANFASVENGNLKGVAVTVESGMDIDL